MKQQWTSFLLSSTHLSLCFVDGHLVGSGRTSAGNCLPIWQERGTRLPICWWFAGLCVVVGEAGQTSRRWLETWSGHRTCFVRLRKGKREINKFAIWNLRPICDLPQRLKTQQKSRKVFPQSSNVFFTISHSLAQSLTLPNIQKIY